MQSSVDFIVQVVGLLRYLALIKLFKSVLNGILNTDTFFLPCSNLSISPHSLCPLFKNVL